ncbi:MAG: dihydrofolate reductase [Bacteroidetes bacterium]|nr:dihydrofolate reductase [Bacteroidota bacterium]
MIISLIVAASTNNAIGKDNRLLWHLPNDMKYFKNTTWAMPVIMGRKTYESMDNTVLHGRFNIIVTRQKNWNAGDDRVQIANSLDKAIELAKETDCKEVFVIGGGELFKESMSVANRIYLTRVHVTIDGDSFFPDIKETDWKLISDAPFPKDDRHAFDYSFQVWDRKK